MRRHSRASVNGSSLGTGSSRARFGSALACVFALCAFLGISAPSAGAVVNKAVTGSFGATGTEGGQLTTPRGVAVNQTSGDVYAVDGANNRVTVFNSAGGFVRAFGFNVAAPWASEVQTITITGTGNFKLVYDPDGDGPQPGQTTAQIAESTTGANIATQLAALPAIGAGNVTGTGIPGAAPKVITFTGALGAADHAQLVAIDMTGTISASIETTVEGFGGGPAFEVCNDAEECQPGLAGSAGGQFSGLQGIAVDQPTGNLYVSESANLRMQQFDSNGNFIRAWGQDVVATGSPGNSVATSAVQSLNVTATAGKYTLTFGGKTTSELAFNATAAQVQTALLALTSIGAGNIEVTGASLPYTITFKGALANNPEPTIVAASGVGPGNELEGGTATVTSVTAGATGFEVCVAANNDICKVGISAATGGAFKSTANGFPAVAPTGAPNAGNVLVADPANLRVQEFSATGAFVRTFGFNVVNAGPSNNGTTNFEVCSAAAGDVCREGATGAGNGQFVNSIRGVAEDAAGNVYTLENEGNATTGFRVQKFTLPGNVVTPQGVFSSANLKGTNAASAPLSVAVDPSTGNVLVTKAFAAGATPSCPDTGVASVAERRIVEVSSAGALEATHMGCAAINVVNGIAVRGSSGDVYVTSTTGESRIYVLNAQLAPPTVGLSGVSDIDANSATVFGFVNPNGPALAYGLRTGYHVSYKRSVDSTFVSAPVTDVDLGKGTGNLVVSQHLVGLQPATSYDVKIVATRPFGGGSASTAVYTFSTSTTKPDITTPVATSAANTTDVTAALSASINPNGQPTTYRFEYGTSSSYGKEVPLISASAGSGGVFSPVYQSLTGLQPATTYHYRVVAENVTGETASSDRTFTTPTLGGLPEGRAYELVSPADKGAVGTVQQFSAYQTPYQVADDGQSILYPILNGLEDATAGGETQYIASRQGGGWSSSQFSNPSLIGTPFTGSQLGSGAAPGYFRFAPPDLSCGLVETFNPLTDDSVVKAGIDLGMVNLYKRDSNGSYTLISNVLPSNFSTSNLQYEVFGISDDCEKIYFETKAYEFLPGAHKVYEWDHGILRDPLVLPNGSAVAGRPGSKDDLDGTHRGAVSANGSRFIFNAISDEGIDSGRSAVFLRKGPGTASGIGSLTASSTSVTGLTTTSGAFATGQTITGSGIPAGTTITAVGSGSLSLSQPAAVSGAGVALKSTEVVNVSRGLLKSPTRVMFEAASRDASKIFFTGPYGITQSSSGGASTCAPLNGAGSNIGEGCDLYVYDAKTGTLRNLSADTNPADVKGASVAGVLDVSDDGSYVYFAAQGQLVPGKGNTYAQNTASPRSANLYLNHAGEVSYVGTVLAEELPNGIGGGKYSATLLKNEGAWTSNATPDGRHLVFATKSSFKGYSSGGMLEAYRYSAEEDTTVCVSCRPDGQPSVGYPPSFVRAYPPLGALASGGGSGFHYPRSVSDDGRVFFMSPNVLAPGALGGGLNVYEWVDGAIYLLASQAYLADSGADGRDVFVESAQQLSPHDVDFTQDLYDVRVGGGFPPPPPAPVPCDALNGECQGPANPQPGSGTGGATENFTGPGNDPTPPKKSKKSHKKKHKKKAKKKQGGHKRSSDRATKINSGGVK